MESVILEGKKDRIMFSLRLIEPGIQMRGTMFCKGGVARGRLQNYNIAVDLTRKDQ